MMKLGLLTTSSVGVPSQGISKYIRIKLGFKMHFKVRDSSNSATPIRKLSKNNLTPSEELLATHRIFNSSLTIIKISLMPD